MKRPAVRLFMATMIWLLLPVCSWGAYSDMNNFCVTPPFIQTPVSPNLLLMIDNSASMYDLGYQDTTNIYCANAPTTACNAGTTCSGAAYCLASATTTTTTTPAACTTDADCQPPKTGGVAGDTCFLSGKNKNTCKTAAVSTTTVTPISCTTDATCSAITAGDTCNNKCTATRQCYDTTYANTASYYGYFDSTATYSYDFTNNKFTSGATMPATCTYANTNTAPNAPVTSAATYFCVNTSGTPEAVVTTGSTGFVASGNFLNWLTASKFDIEKKILTGGKFDTVKNVLSAESRGCGGREFLKVVPGVNLTFAIRGGTPGGIGSTQSLAAEYGQTYIDVYTGVYNTAACLSAMNDWVGVVSGNPPNLGTFQNDSKACVGAGTTPLNPTNMWNHALHNCYKGILNIANGYSGNLGPLEGECQSVYATIPPSAITDPNSGFAICSSVLTYTIGGTAYTGYLGACWNGTNFTGPCTPNTLTDLQQMVNYCNANVTTNPVVDPSSTAGTLTTASIPGFVMQQGLSNLTKSGVLTVKVGLATPPDGLVKKYQDTIRFGAMTFQNNGSGSECGPTSSVPCAKACSATTTRICYLDTDCPVTGGVQETCGVLAKTDGGRIISYVGAGNCSITTSTACKVDSDCPAGEYCKASVGDHSSGLIKNIDDIQATSWTPFAEAFYSAIGYLARSNDYTVSPPTSRSDSNFALLPAPNTATSYDSSKNPSQYKCQLNNIMLVTDGMSTADQNTASEGLASLYASQVPNTVGGTTTYGISGYDAVNKCPAYSGSRSISDLAWVAKNRNIKTLATSGAASTASPQTSSESITTYVVYSGPTTSGQPGLCDPKTLMTNTATNGGTTLYSATNPTDLYNNLNSAFSSIVAQTASGTAASILSNSERSGASLLQALFYPKKEFDKLNSTDALPTSVSWIGELQSFWYYLDPFLQNTSIREDTNSDYKLNLQNDKIVQFYFDPVKKKALVNKYTDANGDGLPDSSTPDAGFAGVAPETVKSLWMAGRNLWNRDVTTAAGKRTIYTGYNSTAGSTPQKFSNTTADNFNTDTSTTVWDLLQVPDSTVIPGISDVQRKALATKLINYVSGGDQPDDTAPCLLSGCKYRGRKVTIQSYCSTGATDFTACTHEWKLGDIISSTPKLVSNIRVNTYNLTPPIGYNDTSYGRYVASTTYANRGMAFVGANDGMLHAFKLGILKELNGRYDKAQVTTSSGSTVVANLQAELGQEAWAYIPKHALPYLKYQADPNYNHIYYVDKSPLIVDASIGVPTGCTAADYSGCAKSSNGSTWRTILIGGMGIGGASREQGSSSSTAVQPPIANVGYSSYFALDVTDPANPNYLWEFYGNTAASGVTPTPKLGFSTTGPAIVRIASKLNDSLGNPTGNPDNTKNGKWFAVFASGPLGPIDTGTQSFKGQSDQPLYIFIVDLATGTLLRKIDCSTEFGLGLTSAFGGSLASSTLDADRNNPASTGYYSDDAVYVGYVQKDAATNTWTKGGVLRLTTKESTNPNDWVVSKLIDGVGPVTTSATKLQDRGNKKLWVYFGTGRYYYKNDDYSATSQQQVIYGVKDPCYTIANTFDKTCTTTVSDSITTPIVDQSGTGGAPASTLASNAAGWKIVLDDKDTVNNFATERVITDPLAAPNGAVFFTTFKPSSDSCQYGGNSLLWAVRYDTGATPPASAMKGKALMQVSTGAFQEITLSSAFKNPGSTRYDGRRLATPITGVPPTAQGLSLFSNPLPVKKILHYQEK